MRIELLIRYGPGLFPIRFRLMISFTLWIILKRMNLILNLMRLANAVVVHTIHGVKGLEYPVVIVANCNVKTFPSTKGESGSLIYNPVIGLRGKKTYGTNGKYYYRFNNWKTDLLSSMIKSSDYDEERRLLYVASTRAKQYLYFTAYKPSPFFEELAERTNHKIIDDFEYEIKPLKDEEKSSSVEIKIDKKLSKSKKFISPHKIMDDIDSTKTPQLMMLMFVRKILQLNI